MDTFKKLNLFIGGFPICSFKSEAEELPSNEYLLNAECPPSPETAEIILRETKTLLDLNAETSSLFCNHPNSIVSLDSGDHCPSWVSQYLLARDLHPIVEDQIQKWLEAGIIVPFTPSYT